VARCARHAAYSAYKKEFERLGACALMSQSGTKRRHSSALMQHEELVTGARPRAGSRRGDLESHPVLAPSRIGKRQSWRLAGSDD
jgi:hypothetical protein